MSDSRDLYKELESMNEDNVRSLIEAAKDRLEDIEKGGWEKIYFVDFVGPTYFKKYEDAVRFLIFSLEHNLLIDNKNYAQLGSLKVRHEEYDDLIELGKKSLKDLEATMTILTSLVVNDFLERRRKDK